MWSEVRLLPGAPISLLKTYGIFLHGWISLSINGDGTSCLTREDHDGDGIWIFNVALSLKHLTLAESMRAITDPAFPVEIDLELEQVREIRPIDAIQLYKDWTCNL